MKIIFVKSRSIVPMLIRLVTWSRYHHCAAIMEDGHTVIESSWKNGVSMTSLSEFKARYSGYHISELDCVDDKTAYDFLHSQLGKSYDNLSVFGTLFRTGWQSDKKWTCSELIAKASGRFRESRVGRVAPEHLWMISHDVG